MRHYVGLYMVLRLLILVCLISASVPSLSQESGKAKPHVPTAKTPAVASKADMVYVVGDVRKPMGVVMDNTGGITVLQALTSAEGANPTADLRHAKVLRKGEYGHTKVPVDIKNILQGKAQDVRLQADDILFVPRSVSRSAGKHQKDDFYDVPPSGPLPGPTPTYSR
ncbi:MAG: polysaccharide biosynthesis/export family protein [Terriglobales bacterium]